MVLLTCGLFRNATTTLAFKKPAFHQVVPALSEPHTLDMSVANTETVAGRDFLRRHEAHPSTYPLLLDVWRTIYRVPSEYYC